MPAFSDKHRIGYACKIHEAGRPAEYVRICHTRTTTAAWMRRQTPADQIIRLRQLVHHNVASVAHMVVHTNKFTRCGAVRISSDILPLYTHPEFKHLYQDQSIQDAIHRYLPWAGQLAYAHDIRLSFHPGQFCCLASDRDDVIDNSVEEFEYHVMMATLLNTHGIVCNKVNVHLSGRGGADKFREVFNTRLSAEARQLITIENDEVGAGLDEVLKIHDLCPIVLDIHHHWVHSGGEYIRPEQAVAVWESWRKRGGRPMIHYSYPRAIEIADPGVNGEVQHGDYKRGKLRAHSDRFPNHLVNRWAASFIPWADIMCEAKHKDAAAEQLLGVLDHAI